MNYRNCSSRNTSQVVALLTAARGKSQNKGENLQDKERGDWRNWRRNQQDSIHNTSRPTDWMTERMDDSLQNNYFHSFTNSTFCTFAPNVPSMLLDICTYIFATFFHLITTNFVHFLLHFHGKLCPILRSLFLMLELKTDIFMLFHCFFHHFSPFHQFFSAMLSPYQRMS